MQKSFILKEQFEIIYLKDKKNRTVRDNCHYLYLWNIQVLHIPYVI